jgi:hypothetical protein
MKILTGHTSPETAYLVPDYPYGFRLRCQIRYWLDIHPRKGTRFVSQTTNPKVSGTVWNQPKASTYCSLGGAMILTDEGHVHWTGIHEYTGLQALLNWCHTYGAALPPAQSAFLDRLITASLARNEAKARGEVFVTIRSSVIVPGAPTAAPTVERQVIESEIIVDPVTKQQISPAAAKPPVPLAA